MDGKADDAGINIGREVLAVTHCFAALLLALMAAGAPHYPLSELFGVTALPPRLTARCWC